MAHFGYTRSPGFWVVGVLDPAELADLDAKTFKSINGDEGGAWAPSATIIIGGSGVDITGPSKLDNVTSWSLTGDGYVTNGATLEVSSGGAATFQVDTFLTLQSGSELEAQSGSLISITGQAVIQSTGDVEFANNSSLTMLGGSTATVSTDGWTFDGITVEFENSNTSFRSGNTVQVDSGCDWTFAAGSTLANGAATTRTAMETRSGAGARTRLRVTDLASNSDHSIDHSFDHYFYSQTTAVIRAITLLRTTGTAPEDGEVISLTILNTSATLVAVKNEGAGATIVSLDAGVQATVRCVYSASALRWRIMDVGHSSTETFFGGDA